MPECPDHDLLMRLDERYRSLAQRVAELEEGSGAYARQSHLNRIERIIWIVGTTVTVTIVGGLLAAIGKFFSTFGGTGA